MTAEKIILNQERNVSLTAYIQNTGKEFTSSPKRPAIVVLPGGGYGMCSDREADPVAFTYLNAGYHVFILRYSVKEHRAWPNPLNDYEQAMELIKSKSEEWRIYADKIVVAGFSAGGHLAACAATVSKYRPAAAILGYAALDKETKDFCNMTAAPVPVDEVDRNTCPCFLFSSREDTVVPVKQHNEFEAALIKHNISFESHVYAYAPHGWSTGEAYLFAGKMCSRAKNWAKDSIEWLKDIFGDFDDGFMTEPQCGPRFIDDLMDFLSVNCTLGHLKAQGSDVQKILKPILFKLEIVLRLFKIKDKWPVDSLRIRDIAAVLKIPPKKLNKINAALNQINKEPD